MVRTRQEDCANPNSGDDLLRRLRDAEERAASAERLRDELGKEFAAIDDANRAKDNFIAWLSHELRSPLSPATAALSLLARREDLPVDAHEMVATARRNLELEVRLIDDMLDLTRIGRGKLELRLQPVDIHHVVSRAIEVCQPAIVDKRLPLNLSLEATDRFVNADPARIQQVLWNLLHNACKFTPAGGYITVGTHNPPRDSAAALPSVIVQVEDTGIGIDPEVLPRLFEPPEQGGHEVTRQYGGLGLGLSLSRKLVEMHHGHLTAASPGKDRGAIFTLELPTIAAPPPPPEPSPAQIHSGSGLGILVVEDHADTARMLARVLEALGHRARTATSKATALAALDLDDYDLLIADLGLPDGSGLDLAHDPHGRGVPAIALSGYGMPDDVQRSLAAGFLTHLVKPVNVEALEATLADLAGKLHRRGHPRPPTR